MPNKHGGGPIGAVTVDDSGNSVIQAFDSARSYLEIQNNNGSNGQPASRIHIKIGDDNDPAVYGQGLYIEPGGVYTIDSINLTPAKILAVTDTGLSSEVYFQVGR